MPTQILNKLNRYILLIIVRPSYILLIKVRPSYILLLKVRPSYILLIKVRPTYILLIIVRPIYNFLDIIPGNFPCCSLQLPKSTFSQERDRPCSMLID